MVDGTSGFLSFFRAGQIKAMCWLQRVGLSPGRAWVIRVSAFAMSNFVSPFCVR